MSKTQEEFLNGLEAEKEKGLVSMSFCTGDITTATVDSFIEENNAIDRAIENKRYSPIPQDW